MIDIITMPIIIENKKIDSRHRLSILGSQRAKQIIQATTSSSDTRYEKATTVALEEILENKVHFVSGKEAITAQKDAKRVRDEELRTWARMAKEGELVTEIKKEVAVYKGESVIGAGIDS
ncbi:MAG: DNA-directed RNA polymerase subunit omega [Nitrospirae bacterium]|nr:DNA-directed RNA polymerase subunit omega [Nitrospirota bacterium]MBI3593672.1 DNA-directed RNA polymerase subunit omega [Nitrospirota bacterium]